MFRRWFFRAAGLLTFAGALTLAAPVASQDTIVRPPKFDYTMTTLANGLQVVMLEDQLEQMQEPPLVV